MKIIYVAHKMGEAPEQNAIRVKTILSYLIKTEPHNTFIAPYLTSFELLDDSNSEERSKGLQDALNVITKCDEVWIFSEVSSGIKKEIETASSKGIPIYFKEFENGL